VVSLPWILSFYLPLAFDVGVVSIFGRWLADHVKSSSEEELLHRGERL
jgi:hypothetical protein